VAAKRHRRIVNSGIDDRIVIRIPDQGKPPAAASPLAQIDPMVRTAARLDAKVLIIALYSH